MNIIQRNFFRLLRSGAFNISEPIEPMSVFIWERLYQLAFMHQVVPCAYDGLLNCKDQFTVKLSDAQWQQWQDATNTARCQQESEEDEFLRADHLTNPLLNHKLQNILDDEQSDDDRCQGVEHCPALAQEDGAADAYRRANG